MFLARDYIANSNRPHDTRPAIEIERFERSERGLETFVDFLARYFDVNERGRVADALSTVATLVLFEKVELRMDPSELWLICKSEKTRDRILEVLLEHRFEWAKELGPLRYALRPSFWTEHHAEQIAPALVSSAVALAVALLYASGIYLEDDTAESGVFWVVGFAALAVPFGYKLARTLWVRRCCRSGAVRLPSHLELTHRAIAGLLREETWSPAVVEVELAEIEKIWFMTRQGRGAGGWLDKNERWRYRYDPFWLLGPVDILGLKIRAGGRTHRVWADRFERADDIRDLTIALHQSVREFLFPEPKRGAAEARRDR